MGDFTKIIDFFSQISVFAVTVLPIFTLCGLIVPKMRKWLIKNFREIFGVNELRGDIDGIKNDLAAVKDQIACIEKNLNEHIVKDEDKLKAQMVTLKDTLMRAFSFYMDRKYITLEELDTLQDVYNAYIRFNGNGVFKAKWENEILKLPNIPS